MKLILANEQQKIQRDHLTYEAWGEGLSLDRFLLRETGLRNEPWCKKEMKTWLLQAESGDILASCETFRMKSVLKGQGAGYSLGIASVYVEPKLRGHGYSNDLIRQVIEKAKQENRDSEYPVHAVFLFSEVGTSIYQRVGFKEIESKEWIFPVESAPEMSNNTEEVHWISSGELSENSSRFFVSPRNSLGNEFYISVQPDQIRWHLKRQDLYTDLLERKPSRFIGIFLRESFMIWMVDYKHNCLRILLWDLKNQEDGDILIAHAMKYAKGLDLKSVKAWDVPEAKSKFNPRHLHLRDDSIAMIHPLIPELSKAAWLSVQRAIWI